LNLADDAPMPRMESAKADFVFFQRRIHSLQEAGRTSTEWPRRLHPTRRAVLNG
jgi:hypothetical protein